MSIRKGDVKSMTYLGRNYGNIRKYYKMKRYYLMAIKKGCPSAMNNLGMYYFNVKKNYIKMQKYYLMGIEKGNLSTIYNLGYYYQMVENNYDKMKEYYLIAIEKGCHSAMYHLAEYYRYIEHEYELMEKYYLMGINAGYADSFEALGYYYELHDRHTDTLQLSITYPTFMTRDKIIKQFNRISLRKLQPDQELKFLEILSTYKFEETDELYTFLRLLINTLNEKISLIDLHFTYTVNGKGYDEAKNDFLNRCL
jgi:TPR repeat protein